MKILKVKSIASIVLAIILIAVLALGISLYQKKDNELQLAQNMQVLQMNFVQQYGLTGEIIDVIEPQQIYMVVWDEPKEEGGITRHVALYVDGLFDEWGTLDIPE